METVYCTTCDKTLEQRGVAGHLRSNVHLQGGGDPEGSDVLPVGEDGKPIRPVEDVAAGIARALPGRTAEEMAEVLAENERLQARIAELESQNRKLAPFVDVPVFASAEEVIEWYGPEHMEVIGEIALAVENKDRMKQGRPPLYSDDHALYRRMVNDRILRAAREMVAQQTSWVSPEALARGEHSKIRTFKMVQPVRDECDEQPCYRHGKSFQVPIDAQFNNGAGSMNDPIERYKRKGAKLMTPFRCSLIDCWGPASVADGRFAYTGQLGARYCSQAHRNYIEGSVTTGTTGSPMTVYETGLVDAGV